VGNGSTLFRRRVHATSAPAGPEGLLGAAGLFREYAPFAWRVLRRLGVAERDADDVCQEVFVTAHRRIASFEGRSSQRTWLYGICVRTASEYRRRAVHRHEVLSEGVPEAAVDASQEEDAALREARATLDRILGSLDDDKRAVFVLYEIEELPMTEVAVAVGCPLQTAYSRLHAARRDVDSALHRLHASEVAR
jgi:RNA polymerase sigma-70 factor, ECF subfamily